MNNLSAKERELVALGAALASNCVPCIERIVPDARRAGLTQAQIEHAIRLAERVRQIPAGKVLDVALGLLGEGDPAGGASACTGAAQPPLGVGDPAGGASTCTGAAQPQSPQGRGGACCA